jgi:O-antigen ligase
VSKVEHGVDAGSAGGAPGRLFTWVLIGLIPALTALITWDPQQTGSLALDWIRLFGVPTIIVELWTILFAASVGASPIESIKSQAGWFQLLLSALCVIAVGTAALVAPNRLWGTTFTLISLIHLMFGLSVAELARTSSVRQLKRLWAGVAIGVCVYAGILAIYVGQIGARFDWMYFGLAVTNIRQTGFYSAVGAAAGLGLAMTQTRWRLRLLWSAAAAVALFISFWSGTRSSLVAIAIAFPFALIVLPQLRNFNSWLIVTGSAAGGILLSLCLPSAGSRLLGVTRLARSAGQRTLDDLSSGRLDTWTSAWRAIMRRPLFGYGEGQYRWSIPQTLSGGLNHPHDIFLQTLLAWGLVGTVIVLILASVLVARAYRALQVPNDADVPSVMVVASLATYSLYEGALFHTYPTMVFCLALAILLGARREGSQKTIHARAEQCPDRMSIPETAW